ncbi:MAG TPA: putative glycoside hydrolase, partial [Longimicrobium sp.]|nr:putative glycoside hydrolase [Longimicrobium sp.]
MTHRRSIRTPILCAALVVVAALTTACGTDAEARPARAAVAAVAAIPAPPVAAPDSIRALYVNGWAAGSRSRMRELIRMADETEINTFVIDVKESDTYLTYDSTAIPLARQIGAHTRPGSRWLPALLDTLRAHRIHPIARIVVFKDRMLAERRPDLAIRSTGGGVWKDAGGKPWVNPYSRVVWDYNVAIAREALDMGFREVQWDYVRFPDVNERLRRQMVFLGANGKSRADNIHDFIQYSRDQLGRPNVPITADVFGLATHLAGDVGIGQNWERLITVSDRVLPMVYPSHYHAGMYGFQRPNAHPYEIVRISMQDAVERTRRVRQGGARVGEVVPWLQAFTADYLKDGNRYGPAQLRQQIQATYDSGLKSWVL